MELINEIMCKKIKELIDSSPENQKFKFSGTGGIFPIKTLPKICYDGHSEFKIGRVHGIEYEGTKEFLGIVYYDNIYKYTIQLSLSNIQKVESIVKPLISKLVSFEEFKTIIQKNGNSFSSVICSFEKLMKMSIEEVIKKAHRCINMTIPLIVNAPNELSLLLYYYYTKFIEE